MQLLLPAGYQRLPRRRPFGVLFRRTVQTLWPIERARRTRSDFLLFQYVRAVGVGFFLGRCKITLAFPEIVGCRIDPHSFLLYIVGPQLKRDHPLILSVLDSTNVKALGDVFRVGMARLE